MLTVMKRFYGNAAVGVTRILRTDNTSNRIKSKSINAKRIGPDAYDLCIKAKAIARSAGAEQALSYALNKLPSPQMSSPSSKPVMINTVMSALSREGNTEKFWEVFNAKVDGQNANWSPQLAATLLNQLAKEMEVLPEITVELIEQFMGKATQIYLKALETIRIREHVHLHNAYLKCISRSLDVPYLMWILSLLKPDSFADLDLVLFGVKKFIPLSESALKLAKLLGTEMKRPVNLDSHSLTSILSTLSRSQDGSIQLAEAVWSKFEADKSVQLDKSCHLALLLVYRNDLSRIFRQRKLIRSTSWRERKLSRVMEIIESMGGSDSLRSDPKLLSIYFEICFNAKLKEKVALFLKENKNIGPVLEDKRLVELISKSKKGNLNAQQE